MSQNEIPNGLKIISWNINGIKSLFPQNVINRQKELQNQLDYLDAPIICFQEAKLSELYEDVFNVETYNSYYSLPVHKKGYSGVVTYTKSEYSPLAYEEGLSGLINRTNRFSNSIGHYGNIQENFTKEQLLELDSEGRVLITLHQIQEFSQKIALLNIYIPRLDPEKSNRKSFKIDFLRLLSMRTKALQEAGHFVIIAGDFNIKHQDIDIANFKDDLLDEEPDEDNVFKSWMTEMLSGDFIDSFRFLYPSKTDAFTCWCTQFNHRIINFGSRIDYFLVDNNLKNHLTDTSILSAIYGSDHCPLKLELKLYLSPFNDNLKGKKNSKITNFFSTITKRELDVSTSENKIKKPKITNFFAKIPKEIEMKNPFKTDDKTQIMCDIVNSKSAFKNQTASDEWHKVFLTKKQTPLCKGHQEQCVLRKVTKQGPNIGRSFWVCPRPPGSKNDSNFSCNHFEWKNQTK